MQRTGVMIDFQAVRDCLCILVLRWRSAADHPAERELDGDVVCFLERKLEINGMDALHVVKEMLFCGAE